MQFVAVYITTLPTKGTLYQRNSDGSLGAPITQTFVRATEDNPLVQYAIKVRNV